jgi:hypothetical protein
MSQNNNNNRSYGWVSDAVAFINLSSLCTYHFHILFGLYLGKRNCNVNVFG